MGDRPTKRTHWPISRSEQKRVTAQYTKQQARKHSHVCEHCPDDTPYECTGYMCRNLKKKMCKGCRASMKYHGTVLATPAMDFKEHAELLTDVATIGQYAAFTIKPMIFLLPLSV